MPIPDFKPGDLIDAGLLKAYFLELEARIETLEKKDELRQGQVIVSTLIPPNNIRIGEILRILGKNFYFSDRAARVTLNGLDQTIITETSSDTELQIRIPPRAATGRATLQVSNSFTSTVPPLTITILPAEQPLTGNISITFVSATPTRINLKRSGRYTFRFELSTMGLSEETSYQITPDVTIEEWRGDLRLEDENGNEIHEPIMLKPNRVMAFDLLMRITKLDPIPPDFTVFFKVDAVTKGRTWILGDHTFTDEEDVSETGAIRLSEPTFGFAEGSNGDFDTATNTITSDQPFDLTMSVNFTKEGLYELVFAPTGQDEGMDFSDRGWVIADSNLTTPVEVTEEMVRDRPHPEVLSLTLVPDPNGNVTPIDFELGYRIDDKKTTTRFHLQREP